MRMIGLELDYVSIDRIIPCSEGSDDSEFEASVINSIKQEGFYNPLTTNKRLRSYKYDPEAYYISLGNHRYWLAKKLELTHVWVLSKVWNCLLDQKPIRMKDFDIDVKCVIHPIGDAPWDIRKLNPDLSLNPSDVLATIGVAKEDQQVGNFTGRLLIQPNLKVNPPQPIKLILKHHLTSLLE